MQLHIVQQIGVETHHLTSARIGDFGIAAPAPAKGVFRRPAVRIRNRGPGHQRIHGRGLGGREENRDAPAARVSEQAELALDPFAPTRVVLDQVEIFQLSRESVSRKSRCLTEGFAISTDAAARKVEGDCRQSIPSEFARKIWEECPVCEALESMANDDRADGRFRRIHLAADRQTIFAR